MAHCHPHKYAIIRNQKSGLVLDAQDHHVKLQHYSGFNSQLWRLESACEPGKFFIVNKGNGYVIICFIASKLIFQFCRKVLDIEGGAGKGHSLITYLKHGGENQQWYVNSDNTIVSACGNLAVDICSESYTAGNSIIAYPKHGGANQQFILQYQ